MPASFSIALAATESSWGVAPFSKQSNNFFGLSCSTPNEGLPCVQYGNGMWNQYSSPQAGFIWLGRWLKGHSQFATAFQHTNDVAAFTKDIAACYITCGSSGAGPFYDAIMKTIRQYNLTQYDSNGS